MAADDKAGAAGVPVKRLACIGGSLFCAGAGLVQARNGMPDPFFGTWQGEWALTLGFLSYGIYGLSGLLAKQGKPAAAPRPLTLEEGGLEAQRMGAAIIKAMEGDGGGKLDFLVANGALAVVIGLLARRMPDPDEWIAGMFAIVRKIRQGDYMAQLRERNRP